MDAPKVYVTTAAQLNSGKPSGKWFDLEQFSDRDSFLGVCKGYFGENAELVFTDWQGLPNGLISTYGIDYKAFEFIDLDEDQKDIVAAYISYQGNSPSYMDEALEKHIGTYKTPEEWAQEYVQESDYYVSLPEVVKRNIDYTGVWEYISNNGDVVIVEFQGNHYVYNA